MFLCLLSPLIFIDLFYTRNEACKQEGHKNIPSPIYHGNLKIQTVWSPGEIPILEPFYGITPPHSAPDLLKSLQRSWLLETPGKVGVSRREGASRWWCRLSSTEKLPTPCKPGKVAKLRASSKKAAASWALFVGATHFYLPAKDENTDDSNSCTRCCVKHMQMYISNYCTGGLLRLKRLEPIHPWSQYNLECGEVTLNTDKR